MLSFFLIYLGCLAGLSCLFWFLLCLILVFFLDREAIEAFNRWRQLFEVNYTLTTEEERRFKYFKNYFNRKVDPLMEMFGINLPRFADRNKQEFNALTFHGNLVYGNLVYCSVSLESLDQWEEIRARFP
jgi:hypothetical protein